MFFDCLYLSVAFFIAIDVVQSPVPEFSSPRSFNWKNPLFTCYFVYCSFLRCAGLFCLVFSLTQIMLTLLAVLTHFQFVQFVQMTPGDSSSIGRFSSLVCQPEPGPGQQELEVSTWHPSTQELRCSQRTISCQFLGVEDGTELQ